MVAGVVHPRLRIAVEVGIAYFALAAAAIHLTRLSGGLALMWPANAVLIFAFLDRPPRDWIAPSLAAMLASLAATLTVGPAPPAAPFFALANIGEAVIATALLRRFHGRAALFESLRSVAIFVLAAGVAAPLLSGIAGATIATTMLRHAFAHNWADWAIGHGLGTLIAAPVVQTIARDDLSAWWRRTDRRGAVHAGGLLALVIALTAGVFGGNPGHGLFLIVMPVLLASFVLGRPGAALSLLTVALVGGWFTLRGQGPIASFTPDIPGQFQFFQFYLGTLFAMAMPVAASLAERQKLLAAVQQSEASLRVLTDNTTDMLLSLDATGEIRFASESVRRLGGFAPEAMVGRHALDFVDPEHHEALRSAHHQALAEPDRNVTIEYRATRADGSQAWFETNMRAVRGPDGAVTGAVSAIRDVSHRKTFESRLIQQATTDPLTGVLNRRAFIDSLAAAIADPRPATLALLDIDHFKRVNDRHGHPMGDQALVTLAECCRQALRGSDVIARLGGEEFALLLDGAEIAEAAAICDRLRGLIERRIVAITPAGALRITASFGLAKIPPGGEPEAIVAAADRALYDAKQAGRNCMRIAA